MVQFNLLFKTIFRHWNCFLSSVAIDGKDRHWLELEKVWPTFSRFNAMPATVTEKKFWIIVSRLPSLVKYVWFLYGLRHLVITTAHNWSKTAISSWHNQFKTFNEDKPKALVWLSLIKLVHWSLQFDVHKFSSYHTLYWMNLTTGLLVPGLLLWSVILREISQCLNHQFMLLVTFSLLNAFV